MKLRKTPVIILLMLLLLTLLFTSPVRAQTLSDISDQLICQCGCYAVLTNCVHGECMVRDEMTTLIEQKLAQGQSGEQIIQFFVDQYGEQVLASPPKRGLNLVAWVLPFVAILAGGVVIYLALKKWVWRGRQSPIMATNEADEKDEEYRQRVEQELKEFRERGFR